MFSQTALLFAKKQNDLDLSISLCHKQLCLVVLGRIRPKHPKGKNQSIFLHFSTCIVKGVSFFLLIVLSSMVSGTEKLIILLEMKEKTTRSPLLAMHAQNVAVVYVTVLWDKSKRQSLSKCSQPLLLHVCIQALIQYLSNSLGHMQVAQQMCRKFL